MSADALRLIHGDALEVLKTLPDASVHCCVTSPPYWSTSRWPGGASRRAPVGTPRRTSCCGVSRRWGPCRDRPHRCRREGGEGGGIGPNAPPITCRT